MQEGSETRREENFRTRGGWMCVQLDWLISFSQTFGVLSSTFYILNVVSNGKRRILGEGYLKKTNKEV